MNELIKITQNDKGTNVVSARELYLVLGIKTEFTKWCERMFEYGFIENKDYARVIVKNDDNLKGGRSTLIDYALTIDTSKEISMIQRSPKGKEVREYFLACEKNLKQIVSSYETALITIGVDPQIVPQIAKVYRERDFVKKQLEISSAKIIEDKPKVVFADSVIGSSNSILVRQFAKDLCDNGFDTGEKRLYEWFRVNKYVNDKNEPFQNYISMGLFEVITRSFGSGLDMFTGKTTKITGKGQVYFAEKIKIKKQILCQNN